MLGKKQKLSNWKILIILAENSNTWEKRVYQWKYKPWRSVRSMATIQGGCLNILWVAYKSCSFVFFKIIIEIKERDIVRHKLGLSESYSNYNK